MFNLHQPRHVLVLGDEGVFLSWADEKNARSSLAGSVHDMALRNDIMSRLMQFPQTPLIILYNGSGQEFRLEILPRLNGWDRAKLLRRRLQQAFPKAYATASRKIDSTHALLAMVQTHSPLNPWVEALSAMPLSLGLLPVECGEILSEAMPEAKQGWAMLMVECQTGGLRIIVTHDGQLVFSRLIKSQSVITSPAQRRDQLLKLIDDTRGYLARLGLDDRSRLIITYITAEEIFDLPGVSVVAPEDFAKKCGLRISDNDHDLSGDAVIALLIERKSHLWLPLAPSSLIKKQRDRLVVDYGWKAAVAVVVIALCLFSWNLSRLSVQLIKNVQESRVVEGLQRNLLAEQAALAPAGQPLDRLQAALERQRLFTEQQAEPWETLKKLAPLFDQKARVTNLDWRDDGVLRLNVRLDDNPANNFADREKTVRAFHDFNDALNRAMPDYQVEIAHYPFPSTSQETITNTVTEGVTVTNQPEAELTIRKRS